MKPRAFQVHPEDNVATLMDDAAPGEIRLGGAGRGDLALDHPIALGHKVAVRDIAAGEGVIKFGVRIGHATRPIARGAWVHLHNLASDLDERSGTLDLHTGAPMDTVYE